MATNDPVPSRADWLPHVAFTVDHPPEAVWPWILRWQEWIRDYRVEHLTGERDRLGETKRVSLIDANGAVTGSFRVEVVKLLPARLLAYRILPFEVPAFGFDAVQGYEIFNLHDLGGGKTLVTYQTVAQLESRSMPQPQFDEHVRQSLESGARAWTDKYIPELQKRLKGAG